MGTSVLGVCLALEVRCPFVFPFLLFVCFCFYLCPPRSPASVFLPHLNMLAKVMLRTRGFLVSILVRPAERHLWHTCRAPYGRTLPWKALFWGNATELFCRNVPSTFPWHKSIFCCSVVSAAHVHSSMSTAWNGAYVPLGCNLSLHRLIVSSYDAYHMVRNPRCILSMSCCLFTAFLLAIVPSPPVKDRNIPRPCP